MTATNDPWNKLTNDEARRVNMAGRFDFFWVVLEKRTPGLMLRLPQLPLSPPKLPKLKNLNLSFRNAGSSPAFVIALNERSQIEIFETLCRDVVAAGEAATSIDDALIRSVQRTQRWHYLLRGGSKKGLSVEEQRGLVGELAFLRELAVGLGADSAIEAWKGPSKSSKDFEFIGCCIEVKARRVAAKPYVSISSEEQLADVEGCRLFLKVFNISSAILPDGLSLHDHVKLTATHFEDSISVFDQWEEAIFATGYDPENDYSARRWHLGESQTFEVVEGFPRVAVPLPVGVGMVRYSLSLEACSSFETKVDLIKVIKDGPLND
ncbi:PD-(D/E)XK motif protein [Amphritea sp.]|uniref:PD-(D/E)XK motif protein n=1 Tax=Amphritea sp. TaxID=1872502 RepID=UPI003A95177E